MGIDCRPAPEIKWTEHQGKIIEVQIFRNEAGDFTGFQPLNYQAWRGGVWSTPLKEVPVDKFFNSAEEAVAWLSRSYNRRVGEIRVICAYFENELERHKDLLKRFEDRISKIRGDVMR